MAEMKKTQVLGMVLDGWSHKSCYAAVGIGEDWATIYSISSEDPGKGHATELLSEMKKYYEAQGKKFGSSIALNDRMRFLLKKLDIFEYDEE